MRDTYRHHQNRNAGLSLIVSFLNTIDLAARADSIATPTGLAEWLTGMLFSETEEAMSIDYVSRAVEFREAVRTIAGANSGESIPSSAVEAVNRAARLVGLGFHLSAAGTMAVLGSASGGLDAAIASMIGAMHAAMADGRWGRVKICRNPECRRAFYDRSKNRSGIWCEMARCGNRMKARRYRLRRSSGRTAG